MDELGGSAVVVCAPAVFGAVWWPPRLGLAVVLSSETGPDIRQRPSLSHDSPVLSTSRVVPGSHPFSSAMRSGLDAASACHFGRKATHCLDPDGRTNTFAFQSPHTRRNPRVIRILLHD